MALLRPSVWTQQPQQACEIDLSNPISRGLIYAFKPAGTPRFNGSVAPIKSSFFSSSGSDLIQLTSAGVGFSSNGYNELIHSLSRAAATANANLTQVCVFTASNSSNSQYKLANLSSSGGATNGFFIGNGSSFCLKADTVPSAGAISSSALSVGKVYVGAYTSKVGRQELFLNGISQGTTASATTHSQDLNRFVSGANRNPIALFASFNRVLSDAEIKSLSDNPWQIFKPIPRSIFAEVSAGGGGVTITANIGQATASGLTATLTQASTLIATQGTATASGLSATLAQAFTLSANRGTATASGAQATIAQAATISANLGTATASGFAADVQSAGNVTISANIGIATASGRQANIGDSVTVSASRGTATAAGYTAALEIAFTLAANRGTAQATGKTATIYASDVISASMGQGIASGYAALIVAGEIYARAPSGSGPVLVTQNKSRPVQTHATRYSNTGGIRR